LIRQRAAAARSEARINYYCAGFVLVPMLSDYLTTMTCVCTREQSAMCVCVQRQILAIRLQARVNYYCAGIGAPCQII
jgi:hypothetical protein